MLRDAHPEARDLAAAQGRCGSVSRQGSQCELPNGHGQGCHEATSSGDSRRWWGTALVCPEGHACGSYDVGSGPECSYCGVPMVVSAQEIEDWRASLENRLPASVSAVTHDTPTDL